MSQLSCRRGRTFGLGAAPRRLPSSFSLRPRQAPWLLVRTPGVHPTPVRAFAVPVGIPALWHWLHNITIAGQSVLPKDLPKDTFDWRQTCGSQLQLPPAMHSTHQHHQCQWFEICAYVHGGRLERGSEHSTFLETGFSASVAGSCAPLEPLYLMLPHGCLFCPPCTGSPYCPRGGVRHHCQACVSPKEH